MRTILHVDDDLLREAARLTGIERTADVVRAGLEALIQRGAARRLAALGGSQPQLRPVPRRRSRPGS